MGQKKQNCWDFHQCGRESGGVKVNEIGVCPVIYDVNCNGLNSGKNGGRVCWAVAGTFCDGKVQGSVAKKQGSCMNCEFFQKVKAEEADCFHFSIPEDRKKLKLFAPKL